MRDAGGPVLCPTCRFCLLWVRRWHSPGLPGSGTAPPAVDRMGSRLWSSSFLGGLWAGVPGGRPGPRLSCGPCRGRWPARRWCSQRGRRPGGCDRWMLEWWGSGPLRCCGCLVGTKEPNLWQCKSRAVSNTVCHLIVSKLQSVPVLALLGQPS